MNLRVIKLNMRKYREMKINMMTNMMPWKNGKLTLNMALYEEKY